MTKYVWYDPEADEIFLSWLSGSLVLFGEDVMRDCVYLGEL